MDMIGFSFGFPSRKGVTPLIGHQIQYHQYSHPITGLKDDSACVTTKTAGRIAKDGLIVLHIIYMVYNIFHALTLWSVHFLYNTWIVYQI